MQMLVTCQASLLQQPAWISRPAVPSWQMCCSSRNPVLKRCKSCRRPSAQHAHPLSFVGLRFEACKPETLHRPRTSTRRPATASWRLCRSASMAPRRRCSSLSLSSLSGKRRWSGRLVHARTYTAATRSQLETWHAFWACAALHFLAGDPACVLPHRRQHGPQMAAQGVEAPRCSAASCSGGRADMQLA